MTEKKEPIMILCDSDEEYVRLMGEFLRTHREVPWRVHTYTDPEEALGEEWRDGVTLLVVAESTYRDRLGSLRPLRTIILNESGLTNWQEFQNVDKYQDAESVLKSILEVYMEVAEVRPMRLRKTGKTQFIGMYSPVRRCLQTTFALTLSRQLADHHRTLYLNFEHYQAVSELAADVQARDLADLLYFMTGDREKFRLRLRTVVAHMGALDYVPPMKSGQNLLTVTGEEWIQLMQRIEELGDYDFVVMDLSESMQGLFDVLRSCRCIYTMTREEHAARSKITQYEQLLKLQEYSDVLEKTHNCETSQMRHVPDNVDCYTKGDMAEYVRREIRRLEDQEKGA